MARLEGISGKLVHRDHQVAASDRDCCYVVKLYYIVVMLTCYDSDTLCKVRRYGHFINFLSCYDSDLMS